MQTNEIKEQAIISRASDKYKYLQEETVFIEVAPRHICINWHVFMDKYISPRRIMQIAKFIRKGTGKPIYCSGGYLLNV